MLALRACFLGPSFTFNIQWGWGSMEGAYMVL